MLPHHRFSTQISPKKINLVDFSKDLMEEVAYLVRVSRKNSDRVLEEFLLRMMKRMRVRNRVLINNQLFHLFKVNKLADYLQ